MQTTIAPVWCGGLRTNPHGLTASSYPVPSEYQALNNKEWNRKMQGNVKSGAYSASLGPAKPYRYTQPIWHPALGEQQNDTTTLSKRSLSLFNPQTTLPTSTCKIPRVAALPDPPKTLQLNHLRASSVQSTCDSTKLRSESSKMDVPSSKFAAATLPVFDKHSPASPNSLPTKHATDLALEEPVTSGLRTAQMSASDIPTISNVLDVSTNRLNVVESSNEGNGSFSVATSKQVSNDGTSKASSKAIIPGQQQNIRKSTKTKSRKKL
jgi:hypothetical protein